MITLGNRYYKKPSVFLKEYQESLNIPEEERFYLGCEFINIDNTEEIYELLDIIDVDNVPYVLYSYTTDIGGFKYITELESLFQKTEDNKYYWMIRRK